MKTLRRTPGFTLIELLVVVAIIAVLASIIFAAVANSRRNGQQAASLSNLKQWGNALNNSLSDSEGNLPSDGTSGGSGNPQANLQDKTAWFNLLPRYLQLAPLNNDFYRENPLRWGLTSVWINPAVPETAFREFHQPPDKVLFSYAMNSFLSSKEEPRLPISRILHPNATVFMSEKGDGTSAAEPEHIRAYFGAGDPLKDKDNAAHFLFCDGHVEFLKRDKFDPTYIRPTPGNESPTDSKNINRHFTFIPYEDAEP